MSKNDYEYPDPVEEKKAATASMPALERWDYLSIAVLLITFCCGFYFLAVFLAPNSALNPFPPNPVDPNAPPTPTITPIQLEPTWTFTPTIEPSATATIGATFTPLSSPTFFSLIPPTNTPTVTRTPTATKTPKAPFSATVNYLQFFFHLIIDRWMFQ